MEKGKYGIKLGFYGVVAFILAYLGQTTLLFLLAALVLLAEKDEWATRQVIQAIVLCVIGSIITRFFNIFDFVYSIPFISALWSGIIGFIQGLVNLAILVFCIVGIIKNAKGEEANIPLASKFADFAYGIVKAKAVAPQATGTQGFCPKCGAAYNGGAFCNTCGNPMGQAQAPAENNNQQ